MGERKPQNLGNHTRLDPAFHFVLVPLTAGLFFAAIGYAIRHPGAFAIGAAFGSLLFLIAVFMIRVYSLKVQDRVIRLEERMRLALLLPEPLRARIGEFTERQLIAMRFASDAELPGLAAKVLQTGLAPADIKKSIATWRPDYFRV